MRINQDRLVDLEVPVRMLDTLAFLRSLQLSRARYLVRRGWSVEAAAEEGERLGAAFRGGNRGGAD